MEKKLENTLKDIRSLSYNVNTVRTLPIPHIMFNVTAYDSFLSVTLSLLGDMTQAILLYTPFLLGFPHIGYLNARLIVAIMKP